MVIVGAMAAVGVLAPLALEANMAHATSATKAAYEESAGKLTKISDSSLLITPSPGVTIDTDSHTITQNGKTESLPNSATDKNGATVELDYVKTSKGVEVRAISPSASMERSAGKCLTGIGGGAVTGATTGGLAGAGVGTVTLPLVGTVGGGLVGAVGGGVGGGLTGAAATCFD